MIAPGSGWALVAATGINDLGQIVGYGVHGSSWRAFVLDPITGDLRTAKLSADEQRVSFTHVSVTAVFGDYLYVETYDRCMGIKVHKSGLGGAIGVDAMVAVSGVIGSSDGERYIEADTVAAGAGTKVIAPLGMPNPSLGGGDWSYDADTGAGQQGVKDGRGSNNIGLLVRTWGEVTAYDAHNGWFYIDDGSALADGSSHTGVYVDAAGLTVPTGGYVAVTGISSCRILGGSVVRVLKPRHQSDIT
jgi:hypothetical protein